MVREFNTFMGDSDESISDCVGLGTKFLSTTILQDIAPPIKIFTIFIGDAIKKNQLPNIRADDDLLTRMAEEFAFFAGFQPK